MARSKSLPSITLARVYDVTPSDRGVRVLVDRLWPRGVKKESLQLDHWLKELAPSDKLRRWYGHRVERWPGFRERYWEELSAGGDDLELLLAIAKQEPVLLLFAARDAEHANAAVLREFLLDHLAKKH